MLFNRHLELAGQHAFMGASNYHWLNYDEKKLIQTYLNSLAVQRGSKLHDYACLAIKLGIKLKDKPKTTLSSYVNDAIDYKLNPEQVLFYSRNCFGTADGISYDENKKFLRIHDLKTGAVKADMKQLMIYAALFCLEYHIDPNSIRMELRIYQNNNILVHSPPGDEILHIMHTIINFDKKIEEIRAEE